MDDIYNMDDLDLDAAQESDTSEDLAWALEELAKRALAENMSMTAHLIIVAAESIRRGYDNDNAVGA